jgi:hypothetical protein
MAPAPGSLSLRAWTAWAGKLKVTQKELKPNESVQELDKFHDPLNQGRDTSCGT